MPASLSPHDLAQWLITVGGIILVDIALSGDNALVIGAAASRLPARQRAIALLWGGVAAAILRIALTGIATELLLIPLLQAVGGVAILIIAIRMLLPEREDAEGSRRRAADRLAPAILSILIADVSMSIDNVLAIGALAHGNLPLLAVGLLISMALLLLASALVAQLIARFWWLMDLAALALAYLAAQLVEQDPIVSHIAVLSGVRATALTLGAVALVGAVAVWRRFAQARARRAAHSASTSAVVGVAEGAHVAPRTEATEVTGAPEVTEINAPAARSPSSADES